MKLGVDLSGRSFTVKNNCGKTKQNHTKNRGLPSTNEAAKSKDFLSI